MTTEAKVGAFVLGCFAVLAFTVIYLLNAQYSGGTVHYRTYLRYAGGLEPGASVRYGGMICVMINAYWLALQFQIQEGAPEEWVRIVDTDLPSPEDCSERGTPVEQSTYQVAPRSIVVLVRRDNVCTRAQ